MSTYREMVEDVERLKGGKFTKVYGVSDDLIEIEGEIKREYEARNPDKGDLLVFDDGTMLAVKYAKTFGDETIGVWQITPIRVGKLLDKIICNFDEESTEYSDIALFKPGLNRVVRLVSWKEEDL